MLRPLKGQFPAEKYPDLIAGLESPDDAAVWKLDDNRALIFTTDFFTPVVDDPYDYGAISAANSLSDVYAMGGEPFLALNIAALPARLDAAVSAEILRARRTWCVMARLSPAVIPCRMNKWSAVLGMHQHLHQKRGSARRPAFTYQTAGHWGHHHGAKTRVGNAGRCG